MKAMSAMQVSVSAYFATFGAATCSAWVFLHRITSVFFFQITSLISNSSKISFLKIHVVTIPHPDMDRLLQ